MIADISHYSGDIDWDTFSDGLELCIAKVTDGYDNDDARWDEYAGECNARGIPLGAFHYYRGDPEEISHFIDRIGSHKVSCVALDCEIDGLDHDSISDAMDRMKALGVPVGLYTGDLEYWDAYGCDDMSPDWWWLARYGHDPVHYCDLYQYEGDTSVDGCGNLDLNKLYGDKLARLDGKVEKEHQRIDQHEFTIAAHEGRLKTIEEEHWRFNGFHDHEGGRRD